MMKYSLVIIDDNQEWCYILKKEFEQLSHFDIAQPLHDGIDAIDYIELEKPDIIILDIILPNYDGFYIINHIKNKMLNYNPFIYVLSAIGTDKTNKLMLHLDVNYYSIKPIKASVVSDNLNKLFIAQTENSDNCSSSKPSLSSINATSYIDKYLHDLGAPLYRLSTGTTRMVLQICLSDESQISKLSKVYQIVAEKSEPPTTYSAVERNIRSTIKYIQNAKTPYFKQNFMDDLQKITNTVFINNSIYIIRQRIEEFLDDQISVKKNSVIHSGK